MKNIKSGLYEHFKGKNYLVISTVADTEGDTSFVLYTAESENEKKLWIRPTEMFFNKVETCHGIKPRFQYLREFTLEEKRMLKHKLCIE